MEKGDVTILCIVFSQVWREKIHNFIKRLQKYHALKYIRTRMYHHQFPNLGEILQGYPVSNIRDGMRSKYFLHCGCNCKSMTKVKVICAYGG